MSLSTSGTIPNLLGTIFKVNWSNFIAGIWNNFSTWIDGRTLLKRFLNINWHIKLFFSNRSNLSSTRLLWKWNTTKTVAQFQQTSKSFGFVCSFNSLALFLQCSKRTLWTGTRTASNYIYFYLYLLFLSCWTTQLQLNPEMTETRE